MDKPAKERWMANIRRAPEVNECCKDENNLVVEEKEGGRAVGTCKVCKRHHYYMKADPGNIVGRAPV